MYACVVVTDTKSIVLLKPESELSLEFRFFWFLLGLAPRRSRLGLDRFGLAENQGCQIVPIFSNQKFPFG
jgi:hypothetical protein